MNPAVLVPVGEIIVDDRLQPRQDGLADDHIASLMETPEAWPPVVLAQLEAGKYLIDGFHRHEAARQLGMPEMAASVFTPSPGADLIAYGFQLNLKHGRALTLRDRKAYAATAITRYPDLSDREVGRRCGLNHETVGAIRNKQSRVRIPQRQSGELESDVGLLDPIRRAKNATKEEKSMAGYVVRIKGALSDPYQEGSTVDIWPSEAPDIARACIAAMGIKRATETLDSVAADACFLIEVAEALDALTGRAS